MTDDELAHATAIENGWQPRDLLRPGKTTEHGALVRMSIARRLRGRGRSLHEIKRTMRLSDHTSVLWLLRGGRREKIL